LTCRRHASPPEEAAWTAVGRPCRTVDPCGGSRRATDPASVALICRCVFAQRQRSCRCLCTTLGAGYPYACALDGVKARRFRPRTSPRWAPTSSSWAAGKVKAGWHRARQHGGQCHPPCFLPCPCGPVAERRGRAWQPTHPPDSSLQPTQGRRRRSPPDPVRRQVGVASGRRPGGRPRAEPMGCFTGGSGRARLGR